MRLARKIVEDGKFWLPGHIETRLAGRLTISLKGSIALTVTTEATAGLVHLVPEDSKNFGVPHRQPRHYERVAGALSNGECVILEDCWQRGSHPMTQGGVLTTEMDAQRAIIGRFDSTQHDVSAIGDARVSLDGLEYWIDHCWNEPRFEIDRVSFRKGHAPLAGRPIDLPPAEGDTVSHSLDLRFEWYQPDFFEQRLNESVVPQRAVAILRPSRPCSSEELLGKATVLNRFLSFAIDGQMGITGIRGSVDCDEPTEVRLYQREWIGPHADVLLRSSYTRPLFHLRDIERWADRALANWYRLCQGQRAALDLFFASMFGRSELDARFLYVVQALDVLTSDDGEIDGSNLRARLHSLAKTRESLLEGCGGAVSLADEIVKWRNYVSHGRPSRHRPQEDSIHHLAAIWQRATAILKLYLLGKVGFDRAAVEKIARDNYFFNTTLDIPRVNEAESG